MLLFFGSLGWSVGGRVLLFFGSLGGSVGGRLMGLSMSSC